MKHPDKDVFDLLNAGCPMECPNKDVFDYCSPMLYCSRMHAKKYTPQKCANHPDKNAGGRCKKCGKLLCSRCAQIIKNQFQCIEHCSISKAPTKATEPEKTEEKLKSCTALKKIVAGAALTLVLCSLFFGMWALREFYRVKEENLLLKNNRLILISKIKENNLEIRDLKKKLISFNSPGEATLVKQPVESKNPRIQIPDTYLEKGIPLTFNNGSTDKKLVSLTFDGGSEATAAIDILDTLRSRNIKATMFITGQFIQKHPDIVKKIAQDGHELGNHTYKHPHLTSYAQDRTQTTRPEIDADFLYRQLIDAEKLLINRCDLKFSPLWRAPFGEYNRTICRWALQQGYIHVGWRGGQTWLQNLDSNDWIADKETPGYKTPAEVMDKILRMAETNPYGINGGIILMHLGTARKERTQQVHLILGTLIDSLHDRGYEIIPVTELIKRSDINIGNIAAKKEELAATLY